MASKRYFINNLDGLIGNSIIKELGKGDEELEPNHMGTYLEQTRLDKGRGVKKILKRHKPKLSRKKMLEECDAYIYDLNSMINDQNKQDFSDIKYVHEILNNTPLEEQKVMILVSDVRVWSNTPKKIKEIVEEVKEPGEEGEEGEEGEKQEEEEKPAEEDEEKEEEQDEEGEDGEEEEEGEDGVKRKKKQEQEVVQQEEEEEEEIPVEYTPYTEADYDKRVPLDKYKKLKRMEDLILSLQGKENLKILVVCSGVLYGEGEVVFKELFKAAWLQQPAALPYLNEGDNKIPTIHVQDLAKFIIKVAENPPENTYLFATDNAQQKTQKEIIQAVSSGIGSGQIESVEKTELIDQHYEDVFKLELEFVPNPLMVSTDPEAPAEFEWHSEFGLIKNSHKVLQEFWAAHNLRPMKILMVTPENERNQNNSQFDWATNKISEHYRIPVLNVRDIIKDATENIRNDILGDDLREEEEKIQEYLNEGKPRPIDETMKVVYRALKWRLSQNDCMNRGFILDNYPLHEEEANWIFYPQKPKKLERIRPKPKKMKRRKKKKETEEQEEQDKEQLEKSGGAEGEEGENDDENNENEQEDEKKETSIADQKEENDEDGEEKQGDSDVPEGDEMNDSDYEYYEVKEEEQEKPEGEEEEEQQEEEPEEDDEAAQNAPKVEFYFPESYIFIKQLEKIKKDQSPQSVILDYFASRGNEVLVFDALNKEQFEIFESLRIYVERNKRPFNYLQPEEELKVGHEEFYNKRNITIAEKKEQLQQREKEKIEVEKQQRKKLCQEQINYVFGNEGEVDIIKNLPFRNYLLEYVVPELNDGLVEVSNFLPDDPVEFLAEYLYEKSFEFDSNN